MPSKTKSHNVLIVDDDAALSRSVKTLLETRNYRVMTLSSVSYLETNPSRHDQDIILLNLNSAKPSIFKLLNALLYSDERSKLILTTSPHSQLRPDDIFPGKDVKILTQPVAPWDLVSAVEAAATVQSVVLRT